MDLSPPLSYAKASNCSVKGRHGNPQFKTAVHPALYMKSGHDLERGEKAYVPICQMITIWIGLRLTSLMNMPDGQCLLDIGNAHLIIYKLALTGRQEKTLAVPFNS